MKKKKKKLRFKVTRGDCLRVMKKLPDNSVDAIVTDPPYGLASGPTQYLEDTDSGKGFMGKNWDRGVPGPAF
jgi:site-specific DNA-methyltransferase (adenine-specific)